MNYFYFCGWDVSKATLDYHVINAQNESLEHGQIENKVPNILQLIKGLAKRLSCPIKEILHCMENTGLYSNALLKAVEKLNIDCWMEDALQIKSCTGRQKEKTDKIDALRISQYALRFIDKVKVWRKPNSLLTQLSLLKKQRDLMLNNLKRLRTSFTEVSRFALEDFDNTAKKIIQQQIQQSKVAVDKLDKRIIAIVKSNEELTRKHHILTSIPGIGDKTAVILIYKTTLFKKINTAKKCASYAGISPCKYQSGSSIRRRQRVSKACDTSIRTSLTMSVISLIGKDNIFGRFYARLIQKGKTHLQAVNAVRNKLIRVVYACIEKDVIYCKKSHECLEIT